MMTTVKQIKMQLRNCIEDMKTLHGLSNDAISKMSGVSLPTVVSCINRPHAVKAETIEKVYVSMVKSINEKTEVNEDE